MYREMGITPSAAAVAAHYGELLAGFVIDSTDQGLESVIKSSGTVLTDVLTTDTWMKTREDRVRLGS